MKKLLLGLIGLLFAVPAVAATLPAGYTELEYIQSTGTQYIDTGVILGYNFTVSVSAKTPSSSTAIQLFGNNVNSTNGFTCNIGNSSGNVSRFSNVKYTGQLYKNSTDIHTYTVNKNGIKIDNDAIIAYDGIPSDFTQTASFYLLAARTTSGASNIMPSGTQLYSVKVYDNNTLVLDLVPAKNSSGVIGLYDTVSGTFFTNAGTGEFIAGPAVNSCRNLFDKNSSLVSGYINSSGVVVSSSSGVRVSPLFEVKPNTTYTISGTGDLKSLSFDRYVYTYTAEQTPIAQVPSIRGGVSATFTTAQNAKYIRIQMVPDAVDTCQLELGSTATSYVPYDASCHATCPNGGTLQTYTSATGTVTQNGTPTLANPITPTFYTQGNMILRKVGDVADSYDATTGKITRRVGVKVLDGTEVISYQISSNRFALAGLGEKVGETNIGFCTHYKQLPTTVASNDMCFSWSSSGTLHWKDSRFNNDVEGMKAYFASEYAKGTPVIVYYPLETPVEEDWAAEQCTSSSPIKIATTVYNSARFSPVVTELNDTIATIRSVVTNTINQTKAIADLQATKQTRPDEQCPAGKKCLLVEDNDGQPHWYEIIENVYGLPNGYTALEYIQSTGTQWIDTGIKGNMSYKYEIDFQQLDSNNYRNWGAFNQQSYSDGPNMSLTYASGFSVRWTVSGDQEQRVDYISAINANRHKIIIDNGNVTWDGVSKGRSTGHQDNYQLNYNLFLGTINPGGTAPTTNAKSKYYSYKVWNTDGNLIQNFIPAKNSSGVVGMYDTVSGNFFTNAGTGTFTAGPVVQ